MDTYNYGPGYRQSMGDQLKTDITYNNFDWVPASNLYANQYMPHTAAYDWSSQSVNQSQPVPIPETTKQVESFGTPEASTFTLPSIRNSRDLNKLLRMECFYEVEASVSSQPTNGQESQGDQRFDTDGQSASRQGALSTKHRQYH